MDIAQTVLMLRKKKGLSQVKMAKMIDITQASLSHIESGRKMPHKSTIDKICEVLEIPSNLFFLLATQPEDLPEDSKGKYSSIESKLKQLILDAF